MKHLLPLLLALALALRAAAQAPTETPAELVRAGVDLYDAGKYDEAVNKYQQALRLAPTDATARAELALTYNTLGRYADAVGLCQQLIQENPQVGANVYATLGNCFDASKQPTQALAAYRQGIKQYPTNYNLFFNQGVTLAGQNDLPAAIASFERAVQLNPRHASSHMLLGAMQLQQGQHIPGVLALGRFLVLEPASARSPQRRQWLDEAMTQGVSQQDGSHVTVSISAASLKKKSGAKGDDFGPEEMLLSLSAATNLTTAKTLDSLGLPNTPINRFIKQFSSLCSILGERGTQAGRGFTRTYYAPYFAAMEKKGFVPAFAYLIHRSQANAPEVPAWLAAHPAEVQAFQEWSKNYEWPPAQP